MEEAAHLEVPLDQAVLERMEGEHGQAAAGPQQAPPNGQGVVQLVELVVDEDAQRHEGLGGQVRRASQHVSTLAQAALGKSDENVVRERKVPPTARALTALV